MRSYFREFILGLFTFNLKRVKAGLLFIFLDLFFHKKEVGIDND